MTLIDLLKKTQQDFVKNQNLSVSEQIVYTHKTSLLQETVFAFVGETSINNKDSNTLEVVKTFSGLILTEAPKSNDTIAYDGKVFEIRGESKYQLGMYEVNATENKRHNRSRV